MAAPPSLWLCSTNDVVVGTLSLPCRSLEHRPSPLTLPTITSKPSILSLSSSVCVLLGAENLFELRRPAIGLQRAAAEVGAEESAACAGAPRHSKVFADAAVIGVGVVVHVAIAWLAQESLQIAAPFADAVELHHPSGTSIQAVHWLMYASALQLPITADDNVPIHAA